MKTARKNASKAAKAKTPAQTVVATQNESWGFWGTIYRNLQGEGSNLILQGEAEITAEEARKVLWEETALQVQALGLTPEQAREFLDSTAGRHLADEKSNQAFVCNNAENEGTMYDLDRVANLPAWAIKEAQMMAKGLYMAIGSTGRRTWVTIPR